MTQPISDQPASDQSVEVTAGAYRVRSSRVSLDSIVWAFLNGQSAEAIAQSFPVLTLQQVDAALTYYLAHRAQVDAYLAQGEAALGALRQAAHEQDPLWYRALRDARRSAA
jgi:uncharacterized protein (DUF433 family)